MPTRTAPVDLTATERAVRPRTKQALRTAMAEWATEDVTTTMNRLLRNEISTQQFLEAAYRRIGLTVPQGLSTQLSSLHATGSAQILEFLGQAPTFETLNFAKAHAGERITGIQRTSMNAIRQFVIESASVPGSITGLRGNISRILLMDPRFMKTTVNQFKARESKISPNTRASARQAYLERIADNRAEMIARTETITALNAGKSNTLKLAKSSGMLEPDVKQEWIAAPNSCPACIALDGMQVDIGKEFAPGVEHPTLHPNCRCTIGIA